MRDPFYPSGGSVKVRPTHLRLVADHRDWCPDCRIRTRPCNEHTADCPPVTHCPDCHVPLIDRMEDPDYSDDCGRLSFGDYSWRGPEGF